MSNQEVNKEKKQNAWITHLKQWSADQGVPYGSAISDPKCKEAYKNSKGSSGEPTVVEPKVKPKVKKSKKSKKEKNVEPEVVEPEVVEPEVIEKKKKKKNKKNKRNKEVPVDVVQE